MLQLLKHIASRNSPGPSTAAPADNNAVTQLFPFGDEYKTNSATTSKVPPFKKAGHTGDAGYDQKVDIWAVGCLLFELLTGVSIPYLLGTAARGFVIAHCEDALLAMPLSSRL